LKGTLLFFFRDGTIANYCCCVSRAYESLNEESIFAFHHCFVGKLSRTNLRKELNLSEKKKFFEFKSFGVPGGD